MCKFHNIFRDFLNTSSDETINKSENKTKLTFQFKTEFSMNRQPTSASLDYI